MTRPDWDPEMIRAERAKINPGSAYRIAPDTWLRVCPACEREEVVIGKIPAGAWSTELGRHMAYDHDMLIAGLNIGLLA